MRYSKFKEAKGRNAAKSYDIPIVDERGEAICYCQNTEDALIVINALNETAIRNGGSLDNESNITKHQG